MSGRMLTREERWEQKRRAFLSHGRNGFGAQPPPQLPAPSSDFAVNFDEAADALKEDLRGAAAQHQLISANNAAVAAQAAAARGRSNVQQQQQLQQPTRALGTDAIDAALNSGGYRGSGGGGSYASTTSAASHNNNNYAAQPTQAPGYTGYRDGYGGFAATQAATPLAPNAASSYASQGLPPSGRAMTRDEAWAAKAAAARGGAQQPPQWTAPPPPANPSYHSGGGVSGGGGDGGARGSSRVSDTTTTSYYGGVGNNTSAVRNNYGYGSANSSDPYSGAVSLMGRPQAYAPPPMQQQQQQNYNTSGGGGSESRRPPGGHSTLRFG